eukprot:7501418-Alexandrium_andersonii.AAC.1
MVRERVGTLATSLRPAFARIQPGRGRGQTEAGAQALVECTVRISGAGAAEALRMLTGELSAIAARAAGEYFAWAVDSDWEEASV